MATTDPLLAHQAVAALFRVEARMAILHGEERLARLEPVSDVDLASDVAAIDAVRAASPYWLETGLHPIIFWPYDVGGTATVFLATVGAEQGVQLDILHDPQGEGRYGLRSENLLDHAVPGEHFTRLDPPATQMYTARKRQVKGDVQAYRSAMSSAGPEIERVSRDALAPWAARELLAVDRRGTPRLQPSRARRLVQRVVHPVGAWAHLIHDGGETPPTIASALEQRLKRILPHVTSAELPSKNTRLLWWWARQVAPIRWRPGVFLSWSNEPAKGSDIAVHQPTDTDDAARQIVAALRNRVLE